MTLQIEGMPSEGTVAINVTIFSSSGKGSDELCNFDEIGTCIAVLVE